MATTGTADGSTVSLDSDEIRALLPHRPPFLFLDRVTELIPGSRGRGLKSVTASEPFFAGHFPDRALMPGVLIIECLTQLAGIVHSLGSQPDPSDEAQPGGNLAYLAAVRQFKFRRPVTPGDQLVLDVVSATNFGRLHNFRATARVDGHVVAEGSLTLATDVS